MKRHYFLFMFQIMFVCLFLNTLAFADQGIYVDISKPSPIADRTIPMNATTNPIAFTVSDSDGGPLVVLCTSSQPTVVPNDDAHIIIDGVGKRITVDAQKNEKKYLTARIIPVSETFGVTHLTFKVIDAGGLFATKVMSLTVTTNTVTDHSVFNQHQFAYASSHKDSFLKQLLFSTEAQPMIKISAIGNGYIQVNQQRKELPFQTFSTGETLQIEALPEENFQFAYWSGDVVDTENPLSIIADSFLDFQAVFVSSAQYQSEQEINWKIHLWLSNNKSQDIILSEILIGTADIETKEIQAEENNILCVLSTTKDQCLSNQIINQEGEQFRNISINSNELVTLHWEIDQQYAGLFELIDAQTKAVYVSDMQSLSEWQVPDGKEINNLIIHYIP